MLWSLNHLRSDRIRATDGALGAVEDLFFDDLDWAVRYVVVDTAWLLGRRVLLSTAVLGRPDPGGHELPVSLTKEQVKNSPDLDAAQPVSRQQEVDLHSHYGWSPYWLAKTLMPPASVIQAAAAHEANDVALPAAGGAETMADPHLRSGHELRGYAVRAADAPAGVVDDILVDEAGWVVRYLVLKTAALLPGRKFLLATPWVEEISWADRRILAKLNSSELESSPHYHSGLALDRDYEDKLHRHYGRAGYWS